MKFKKGYPINVCVQCGQRFQKLAGKPIAFAIRTWAPVEIYGEASKGDLLVEGLGKIFRAQVTYCSEACVRA